MSDTIQERLRWLGGAAALEAADEIDRLRAELDEEREAYKTALSNRNYWRNAHRKQLFLKEHAERELDEKDKRIARAMNLLDRALGDTDPDIEPDEHEDPVYWAMRTLTGVSDE